MKPEAIDMDHNGNNSTQTISLNHRKMQQSSMYISELNISAGVNKFLNDITNLYSNFDNNGGYIASI